MNGFGLCKKSVGNPSAATFLASSVYVTYEIMKCDVKTLSCGETARRNRMFKVEYHEADGAYNWLIRQIEVFRFDGAFHTEKFIPRPDLSMIFHFGYAPLIVEDKEEQLPPFFAAPIISKSLTMSCMGCMDSFVVVCKPTAFSRLFHIDMTAQQSGAVPLAYDRFHPLWVKLSQQSDTRVRIADFQHFIDTCTPQPYQPDAIDQLYDKIIRNGATQLLKEIMQDCPACNRTLERNFIRRTGVSPKRLMRIVRLNYLWTQINEHRAVSYQDLVFDGNYFDQAHFIKDFKSIIGEPPSYFFNRNLHITKLFSGRAEVEK